MSRFITYLITTSAITLLGLLFIFSYQEANRIIFPIPTIDHSKNKVLGEYNYTSTEEPKKKLGIVYGFLPYWTVDNYQIHPSVSHLAFFRLAVNGKGEIINRAGDGGYQIYHDQRIQSILDQVNQRKTNFELTIFSAQNEEIKKLINCSLCQENLINEILTLVETDKLDGINLDFEYLGSISPTEREAFTHFVYQLKNELSLKYPRTKLSIDVYGGAARMNNIWDFPKLAKIVDRIIVMGYDYKTRKSSSPGPGAPTLGKNIWGGDIWDDIISLTRFVPSEKIVLAVPFYGYIWQTTTNDLNTAKTIPDTGRAMTYREAQNILADKSKNAQEKWDEHSLTPYLIYQQDEQWRIGFFENERSLNYKIDLIEKLNLGGIAVWALGFEGEYQELWEIINERF